MEHTTQKQSESAKPARNLFVQLISLQNGPPPASFCSFFTPATTKFETGMVFREEAAELSLRPSNALFLVQFSGSDDS
jgi:hypothetical protein